MADLIDALLELSPAKQREIMKALSQPERATLLAQIDHRNKFPWYKYRGNPVAFVNKGLGEVTWSKQEEILRALEDPEYDRIAVPATHAPGKTHLAARIVAYWVAVHPPGTARVLTTASTFRQVKTLLWPHIRSLHEIHGLMGTTSQVAWRDGKTLFADGVKPPDDKEAGISGLHAANLLIIIDEAGGIKDAFGASIESLMTGEHTKLVVLGNPPVGPNVGWFERICSSPLYKVIRIAAKDTPNFTGEDTGWCTTCPREVDPHKIATHLINPKYAAEIAQDFGKDSVWYKARIDAEFVHDSMSKTLPMDWLQAATVKDDEENPPGPIKLGCDIASGGGDEFVIAKLDGWRVSIVHTARGEDIANSPAVVSRIYREILAAEQVHKERGITEKVRVKIDVIGVGWGVVGDLQQWGKEGKHNSLIIPVNVANNANNEKKFRRSRDEMWWAMRDLIEPNRRGADLLQLDLDTKVLAQLNAPTYTDDSKARIWVETKDELKERGIHSPDRAEAVLLALYEPKGGERGRKLTGLFASAQENMWGTT
jgi:hypothetical protein